jgi:hypothetical protein
MLRSSTKPHPSPYTREVQWNTNPVDHCAVTCSALLQGSGMCMSQPEFLSSRP